ncbi:RNA polymerase sigma factor [Mucilaginibacter auburnensis]|uniref:RNA polymerase sigma-70 factor (ECF subfamily) n=1 Tax=Mucilaginibacter auburnensis TaxID=1457233 RepID=A0A2H9VM15_9SPHI|nr:sigma-70 family RNA polymerase sigma factor [Mucilaginibacter auburnensis]PJJ79345.1 RNA polymerase sigma-70 factor (ECF subfamily) [Mucilaginibacter auburnensis]
MLNQQSLIAKILQGDNKAFEQLIKQYERLVLHVTGRLIKQEDEVTDVCQEVFIKVYYGLAKFNNRSKLSTWIARIAYLTSINHLRKYKYEHENRIWNNNDDLGNYHFSLDTPETLLIKKDANAYVQHLITQLPVAYRTVLTLYHLEEFSYSEIEEITGMREGTVKNYLFRARKLLKEKLTAYLQNEEGNEKL